MARYVSPKDAAALLRKALRVAHPETKFSVRTSTYAGGASIQVTYEDGPAEATVKEIADQFAGSRFDGMTDTLSPVTRVVDGEEVDYLADFVFVTRNISPGREAAIREYLSTLLNVDRIDDGYWYTSDQTVPVERVTGVGLANGLTGYGLVRLLAEHPQAIFEQTSA